MLYTGIPKSGSKYGVPVRIYARPMSKMEWEILFVILLKSISHNIKPMFLAFHLSCLYLLQ